MRALAVLAALVFLAACAEGDFEAALRAARENQLSPEGARYDETFGASFAEKHRSSLEACTKGLASADLAPFDLVARVGANGKLEVIHVQPATPVARCIEGRMTDDAYPPPPRASYWVHLGVTIHE